VNDGCSIASSRTMGIVSRCPVNAVYQDVAPSERSLVDISRSSYNRFTMNKFRVALALFLCLFGSVLLAQRPMPANQVFEDAKAQAAQQHNLIFLVFGASWCEPCHRMDAFLAAPETRQILGKYFVLAKLNVEEKAGKHPEFESPGGEDLALKLGGANAKGGVIGVPFFLFLDATGEPIVNSRRPAEGRPGGANIGYPAKPEEIDWFMTMLKRAVPSMTVDESRTIDEWLRRASAK
jgi:thioredoxin-related protein